MEKKYVAYLRQSKEGKSKNKKNTTLGIDAQRAIINHFYGPGLVCEFVEVKSAKNMDREELAKCLEYCRQNNYVCVVAKQDRISRNVIDVLTIYDKLNGQLICCDIPSGEAPVEKFMLTIFAAISERERELISIRTKQALQALKRKGVKLGMSNEDIKTHKNVLANMSSEAVKERAKRSHSKALLNGRNVRAVERMKVLLNEGKTWREIANVLNAEELDTRTKQSWTYGNANRVYNRAMKQ